MGAFATFRDDVKYVVVMRNPEEAVVSFKPFIEAHNPKLWELWGAAEMRDKFVKPTFQQFFDECVLPGFPNMPPEAVPPGGLLTMLFFGFVNGWWPLRNKPNVLMLHFNDMKADHEGTIRKIAAFLGFAPTPEQWPRELEYTSFPWMKVLTLTVTRTLALTLTLPLTLTLTLTLILTLTLTIRHTCTHAPTHTERLPPPFHPGIPF